jgi:predicted AlkP superfamily pyrophosphatase or phosphodiesterase
MRLGKMRGRKIRRPGLLLAWPLLAVASICGQAKPIAEKKAAAEARPKLVLMIVVDQMRADYVDKFQGQWSAGLKRLVEQGAWFRVAAYPYAVTETCVGHATVSTGALPMSHGMVANAWFDRDTQKMVTCTSDPTVKNSAYAGGTTSGGDSAWRMRIPAFAEELKFQSGSGTRVVTLSLKARAAITMAGHKADSATWFDSATGAWLTSSAYGSMPFVEEFAKKHPAAEDYGKTWSPALPPSQYLYDEKTVGATALEGWSTSFPHGLNGRKGSSAPDQAFFEQWATSPYADTSLTKLAETAVEALGLGKGGVTDFLGVSYSSVDYVGHTFGPRSWEIQDMLVRLDQDLGELFTMLDQQVGQGNYLVAFTADHGVAPIPLDMHMTGVDAGVLRLPELKNKIENALEPYHFAKPAVARIAGNEVYFSPGVYHQLGQDPAAMKAAIDEALTVPGVAAVFRSEDLSGSSKTLAGPRTAAELSYFAGRSGDLYVLQQPYWLTDSSGEDSKSYTGTGHGTPYYYDQRVPILIMGYGIKRGVYFETVTPADIAPTIAVLTGITLATHDGRVLSEALSAAAAK